MASPFMRATMMMAALSAAIASGMSQYAAAQSVGPYVSRGKRATARHDGGGTRAYQRAAMKKRNRARDRIARRGKRGS